MLILIRSLNQELIGIFFLKQHEDGVSKPYIDISSFRRFYNCYVLDISMQKDQIAAQSNKVKSTNLNERKPLICWIEQYLHWY